MCSSYSTVCLHWRKWLHSTHLWRALHTPPLTPSTQYQMSPLEKTLTQANPRSHALNITLICKNTLLCHEVYFFSCVCNLCANQPTSFELSETYHIIFLSFSMSPCLAGGLLAPLPIIWVTFNVKRSMLSGWWAEWWHSGILTTSTHICMSAILIFLLSSPILP